MEIRTIHAAVLISDFIDSTLCGRFNHTGGKWVYANTKRKNWVYNPICFSLKMSG
jgi:hypothetical protein